ASLTVLPTGVTPRPTAGPRRPARPAWPAWRRRTCWSPAATCCATRAPPTPGGSRRPACPCGCGASTTWCTASCSAPPGWTRPARAWPSWPPCCAPGSARVLGPLALDAGQPGRDDVVELDGGERDHARQGAEQADQRREGVERLRQYDPAAERGQPGAGLLIGLERLAPVPGAQLQPGAEQRDV